MVQNVILRCGDKSLVVGPNKGVEFLNWLVSRFEKKDTLTGYAITGVLNKFDKLERDGVIFRGALLEWLWENRGRKITCEIA